MQFDTDTKATSHGSHLVTFDPRPEPEIEDDAQAEAQNLLGELPEFVFTFSWVVVSQGVEPRAQSQSSFVRRTALRSAASCLASVVLPAPGNPQASMSASVATPCPSPAAARHRRGGRPTVLVRGRPFHATVHKAHDWVLAAQAAAQVGLGLELHTQAGADVVGVKDQLESAP